MMTAMLVVMGADGSVTATPSKPAALTTQATDTDATDALQQATALNQQVIELYQAGRYQEAIPPATEALRLRETALGETHPDVAGSLNNLALLYQAQGDYAAALPLYQRSLAILETALGETHPDVATSLNNLAGLYQAQGDAATAIAYLQAGLNIQEQHLELNLATLADAQRQAYATQLSGTTNGAVSLHLQAAPEAPAAQQLALTTLLRRKGRILDAGVSSRQRLRQNLTAEDQATLDRLTEVQRQLATLTFNPPANLPPEDYRAQLQSLATTANQLEATLAQRSASFRVETQPVELATVQAQIPANGVLVEYVRYQPFDTTAAQNPWGAPRYAAYLLFSNGRIEAVDLGEAAAIDAAVPAFIRLLQDPSADLQHTGARPMARPEAVAAVTDTIQALVFDPIAPYLQDTQHLLISPDGQLNLLPFEALQPEVGGDYLVQRYQISYLTSGRDLLKLGDIEPSRNPDVILANPDYHTADDTFQLAQAGNRSGDENRRSTELSQLQVGPLPGTAAEAEAIQPLLSNAIPLLGDEATENALKQVQSPRILHIATHGFFLADVARPSPEANRGLGVVAADGSLPQPTGVPVENPLLRSGLALAGFNTRSSGREDGVFTALEAAQLNLLGTQLVVLSACETGLGDVANGEGVYGLRRAFALAGAETQLMSLWQVSDFGTQSLMTRYYKKLMAGMGRSEALREVQLAMIEEGGQYSHPYFWAAFVLAGDWRSLE
jgi:CHAT domain-containing protein